MQSRLSDRDAAVAVLRARLSEVFTSPFGLTSRRRWSDDKSIMLLPIRMQTRPTRKRCNLKHRRCKARARARTCLWRVAPSNSTISSRDYDNKIALQLLAPPYRDVVYRSSTCTCVALRPLFIAFVHRSHVHSSILLFLCINLYI